jgi:hypothetical protein
LSLVVQKHSFEPHAFVPSRWRESWGYSSENHH